MWLKKEGKIPPVTLQSLLSTGVGKLKLDCRQTSVEQQVGAQDNDGGHLRVARMKKVQETKDNECW